MGKKMYKNRPTLVNLLHLCATVTVHSFFLWDCGVDSGKRQTTVMSNYGDAKLRWCQTRMMSNYGDVKLRWCQARCSWQQKDKRRRSKRFFFCRKETAWVIRNWWTGHIEKVFGVFDTMQLKRQNKNTPERLNTASVTVSTSYRESGLMFSCEQHLR